MIFKLIKLLPVGDTHEIVFHCEIQKNLIRFSIGLASKQNDNISVLPI